jgi:hypothetical protein
MAGNKTSVLLLAPEPSRSQNLSVYLHRGTWAGARSIPYRDLVAVGRSLFKWLKNSRTHAENMRPEADNLKDWSFVLSAIKMAESEHPAVARQLAQGDQTPTGLPCPHVPPRQEDPTLHPRPRNTPAFSYLYRNPFANHTRFHRRILSQISAHL